MKKAALLLLIFTTVILIIQPTRAEDHFVETGPLVDPKPLPGTHQEVQETPRNRSSFPADYDKYQPMPLPQRQEPGFELQESQLVTYDALSGEEAISDMAITAGELMMAVAGSQDGAAVGETRGLLNFSALSLVSNPQNSPYSRAVKMFFRQGVSYYVCSGALIDPKWVITAGHCVHEGGGGNWSTEVVIVPAYDNGSAPFGDAAGINLASWTGWTVNGNFDHDIGIVGLDRPIGALTGWHGYGYQNACDYFTGGTWDHNGYPAESPYDGQEMYEQSGNFDACEYASGSWWGNEVSFNRRSYGGQSGSGAYRDQIVRAVLSNGTTTTTWDVRLTEAKFLNIRDDSIGAGTPSTFDLIPLDVTTAPTNISAGSPLSSMSFKVTNYSSASHNGSVNLTMYLSTNDIISTADTALGSTSFSYNFAPKSTVNVNVSVPPTIPAATASGTYYIGVILDIADNDTGNNASSGQDASMINVQAAAIPAAPLNVLASDGTYADRVQVTWNSSSGATDYELYRAPSAGGIKTLIANPSATTYNDFTADFGPTYYYWVKACNTSGCSDYSAYDTGYRAGVPPAAAPANVQASDGTYTDKVQVSWNAAAGATEYEVFRATSSGGVKTPLGMTNATTFDDTGTDAARTYYYSVTACNTWGCSDYSAEDSGFSNLAAPANVQASDGTYPDKVQVSWNAAAGATEYEVYRATSSGGVKTSLGMTNATTLDDTSAAAGVSYYYSVKSCNTWGCGDYSAEDSGFSAIAAPANVQASDGTYLDKVQVDWSAAAGATEYEVYRATSSGGVKILLGMTNATTFDDTGAAAGVNYFYWVKSCNTLGCSDYSSFDQGYARLAAPNLLAPLNGSVVDIWTPTFEWSSMPWATEYQIQVDDDPDFSSPLIDVTVNTNSYSPTELLVEGDNYWRVRATDGGGTWSEYTPAWVVTVDVLNIYLPLIIDLT
ncbi:MAG: trypsin-like serine protease [Candidatus Promineifilaceae bacterium]|nr:trypsin-like serine protease [Candidatus Promineifilaceae bacterium]